MKIISVLMISPVARFIHYTRNNLNNINPTEYPAIMNDLPSRIDSCPIQKQFVQMIVNKYKNRGVYQCFFCEGTGYLCVKFSKSFCFQCTNNEFKPCHICGGSRKGGPKYSLTNI